MHERVGNGRPTADVPRQSSTSCVELAGESSGQCWVATCQGQYGHGVNDLWRRVFHEFIVIDRHFELEPGGCRADKGQARMKGGEVARFIGCDTHAIQELFGRQVVV